MDKLDLEKAEEPEIKLTTSCWIIEKAREFQKNVCFIDYAKSFDCVVAINWKILQEMRIPDQLTCLLQNLYAGKKQQLEPDMEQQPGSKLGKEYKAVYCHPLI